MGILTTKDSARSFSTYVALFGLALLVTASLYLRDLNRWAEKNECVDTVPPNDGKPTTDILCSNYYTWRRAAIIGIVIGVIDVLVVPFLLCCGCCVVCGCAALMCACIGCNSSSSEKQTENGTSATTPMNEENNANESHDVEATTPVTNVEDTDKGKDSDENVFDKFTNLPKPVTTILNFTGWAVWVFLPFLGTLLITIWIYKTDAIRTADDQLYKSSLTLFICALLNLMVYYQKFIDSVFRKLCNSNSKKDKKEAVEV